MERPPRGGPMLRQERLENTDGSYVAANAAVAAAASRTLRMGGLYQTGLGEDSEEGGKEDGNSA